MFKLTIENEEDFLSLTKKEYCKKYKITSEEYDFLEKDFQEV